MRLALRLACFSFTFTIAGTAHGQIDPNRPRQIRVIGDQDRPFADVLRLAQKRCMLQFYGPEARPSVGGKGTYMFGALVPLKHGYGNTKAVFAPSLSLTLGLRKRLTTNACQVLTPLGDNPPRDLLLEAPDEERWLRHWSLGLGLATFAFSELPSFKVRDGSFGLTLFLGVDWERVWWSNPDDIGSKKSFTVGLALLTGIGRASIPSATSSEPAPVLLLGAGINFEVQF